MTDLDREIARAEYEEDISISVFPLCKAVVTIHNSLDEADDFSITVHHSTNAMPSEIVSLCKAAVVNWYMTGQPV